MECRLANQTNPVPQSDPAVGIEQAGQAQVRRLSLAKPSDVSQSTLPKRPNQPKSNKSGHPIQLAFRKAEPTDAASILSLEQQLFGADAWTPNMVAEELTAKSCYYLVAAVPQVIAYAGIWLLDDIAQVMTIGVSPTARGQGIGLRLMQALIDQAITAGALEMFLEVQTDNAPALHLYKKFGFEPLAVRKRYYGTKDAYTMRLALR